jgi:hypothetical protein
MMLLFKDLHCINPSFIPYWFHSTVRTQASNSYAQWFSTSMPLLTLEFFSPPHVCYGNSIHPSVVHSEYHTPLTKCAFPLLWVPTALAHLQEGLILVHTAIGIGKFLLICSTTWRRDEPTSP